MFCERDSAEGGRGTLILVSWLLLKFSSSAGMFVLRKGSTLSNIIQINLLNLFEVKTFWFFFSKTDFRKSWGKCSPALFLNNSSKLNKEAKDKIGCHLTMKPNFILGVIMGPMYLKIEHCCLILLMNPQGPNP